MAVVMVAEPRRAAARGEQTHINKQVLPQAPSPTMTSLRRISAMIALVTIEGGKNWTGGESDADRAGLGASAAEGGGEMRKDATSVDG